MIKYLLNLLSQTFGITLWVTLPILFIFGIVILCLVFTSLVLLLDVIYRPNKPQYPFNIILDHIVPLIAIISPSIIILLLNPENTFWFVKFGYIVCIHIFFLVPLIYFWSSHRNWLITSKKNNDWSNPKIYLDITIAMIYPATAGLYLFGLRYFRLGITVDLAPYFLLNEIIILVAILIIIFRFFRSYVIKMFIKMITFINTIRLFFWLHYFKIIKSITFYLLKYKYFFLFCEFFYKVSFLWVSYIIHHPFLYRKDPKPYIRLVIHKTYLSPYILLILPLVISIIEILFMKGKIYYSINIFLILLFFKPIIYFLNNFNGPTNTWVEFCCYSNFIHFKWFKAYYQKRFWLSFTDIREEVNQEITLTKEQEMIIQEKITTWQTKDRFYIRKNGYIFHKLLDKKNSKFIHRFRIAYKNWSRS